MSQAVLSGETERAEPVVQPVARDVIPDAFDYKPVPMIAPVACFFGLASGLGLLSEFALPLCVFAFVLSLFAFRKIRRSEGEYGGKKWAGIGLAASAIFFVAGTARVTHAYATEVPAGYARVHFVKDISDKKFVEKAGVFGLHPDVKKLEGKKIYIKGFMYKTKQPKGLSEFVFLKDNGKCCFGGQPQSFHKMIVKMQNGKLVDSITGLVAVAGVLRCHPDNIHRAADGNIYGDCYVLEAYLVEPARTRY